MPHQSSPPPARPIDIAPEHLRRVQEALDDFRAGRFVILVDDEDRENEGDLCIAAERITPDAVNFMAIHGRGLICLTLNDEQVRRLDLPMMNAPGRAGPRLGTAFTVSIEAREGVTTGISAADRAHTIRVAMNPNARPGDVVVPGHVFPLLARKGGVLVRAGQTEGSVDMARLAGLEPAAVVCEIIRDDGTMARMPDLEIFAEKHGLRILTIADLIAYRLQTEELVQIVAEHDATLHRTNTTWRAVAFEPVMGGERQLLALVKGDVSGDAPVLCRMHRGSLVGDVFTGSLGDGGRVLNLAIDAIEREGRGLIVYLPPSLDFGAAVANAAEPPSSTQFEGSRPHAGTLREYGLGAQVLRHLGVRRIRLLTNTPRRIAALHGYGLDLVDSVPLG